MIDATAAQSPRHLTIVQDAPTPEPSLLDLMLEEHEQAIDALKVAEHTADTDAMCRNLIEVMSEMPDLLNKLFFTFLKADEQDHLRAYVLRMTDDERDEAGIGVCRQCDNVIGRYSGCFYKTR